MSHDICIRNIGRQICSVRTSRHQASGYPIASGVIEGACRHVVVDRMEGTGMRWIMSGAQSMLNLRCIHVSGHWTEFMNYPIRREQNDIYPVKAANDASFGTKISVLRSTHVP